ncbi:Nuclear transcription factor Y subunit A-7 [Hordeum vulgare]|nr:Nuclear transcription factor Y subunit A-7 [Hordeum vulgare]
MAGATHANVVYRCLVASYANIDTSRTSLCSLVSEKVSACFPAAAWNEGLECRVFSLSLTLVALRFGKANASISLLESRDWRRQAAEDHAGITFTLTHGWFATGGGSLTSSNNQNSSTRHQHASEQQLKSKQQRHGRMGKQAAHYTVVYQLSCLLAGDHRADEQQQKQAAHGNQEEAPATSVGNQAMAATPSTDYVTPYGHQEACHAMGQIAYPTIDPYYGSLYAAYGGQPMMHPPMVGMHAAAIPLPTDAIEEPVYVNAKQYNAILRRRQSRAKAESERKLIKGRKCS